MLLLRNAAFVRLCAACFLYFAAMGIGSPVLPLFILGPAGGTTLEVGVAVGIFSLTSLLLRPIVVPLARRFQPPRLVAGGALLVGVAEGLLVLDPSPPAIIGLRAVAGVGEAVFFVLASAAVYDVVPEDRHGAAMSYFSGLLSAGLLASPVLGELLRQHVGYDAVWTAAFALCLCAAALGLTLRLPRLPPRTTPLRLFYPPALRPGLLLAVNTWGGAAFGTFMALYVAHLGLHGAAPEFAVFAVVLLTVRIAGADVLDRFDPRTAACAALSIEAVSLVLFMVAQSRPLLLVSSALLAAGAALAYPALMSLAVRSAPQSERTEAVATATACFDAGFAAATFGLAAALDLAGFDAVFGTAAAVMGAGALAMSRSALRRRSPTPAA